MTCRCTCKAYGGSCDCRFDGLNQGRAKGEEAARTAIIGWLRDATKHASTEWALVDAIADRIEKGEGRP